jgi:hypothetical protein
MRDISLGFYNEDIRPEGHKVPHYKHAEDLSIYLVGQLRSLF